MKLGIKTTNEWRTMQFEWKNVPPNQFRKTEILTSDNILSNMQQFGTRIEMFHTPSGIILNIKSIICCNAFCHVVGQKHNLLPESLKLQYKM